MSFVQEKPYGFEGLDSVITFPIDLSKLKAKGTSKCDAEIEVRGGNVVVMFGYDPAIAASYAIDGSTHEFPDGNYHATAGTVKTIQVPTDAPYFSICPKSGQVPDVYINFGFEKGK